MKLKTISANNLLCKALPGSEFLRTGRQALTNTKAEYTLEADRRTYTGKTDTRERQVVFDLPAMTYTKINLIK